MPVRMHADEADVSEHLARGLVDSQFPRFAGERLAIVEPWGTDNAIWRLGQDHVIRLPRVEWAVSQIQQEVDWLPMLAPYLPVTIPEPVETGAPGLGYPFPWAIHKWITGEGARPHRLADPVQFAQELAAVVQALQRCDTAGAPAAHNRARHLVEYDDDTRRAIESASHLIDAPAALAVWEAGLAAPAHAGDMVCVHGDLEGNCIVRDGQLHGLLDWGSGCAGDPAVDVQVIWSPLFTEESRAAFLDVVQVDEATITRSRAAAINQACGALPYYLDTYPLIVERSWHKLAALGVGVAKLG